LDYLDNIIHVDDAFDSSLCVDNRHHQQVMAHEKLAQRFLIQIIGGGDNLRAHDITDVLIACSDDQITERNHSQ
jgi:hypothetical protein